MPAAARPDGMVAGREASEILQGALQKLSPELREKLPRRHWIGYNDLLVSFGQNVCTPLSPRCSICPVTTLCRKVGVTKTR